MRWLLLAATLFGTVGCLTIDSPDGSLRCADTDMYPGRACPADFFCAGDGRCYRGSPGLPDMSKTGCATLLKCDLDCSVQSCSDNCLAAANDRALALWKPALACAFNFCGGTNGGTMCTGPSDTSASCESCVQGVLRSGSFGTGPCWSEIGPCLAIGNQ